MTAFIVSYQSQKYCQSHTEAAAHWLNCLSQLEKVLLRMARADDEVIIYDRSVGNYVRSAKPILEVSNTRFRAQVEAVSF